MAPDARESHPGWPRCEQTLEVLSRDVRQMNERMAAVEKTLYGNGEVRHSVVGKLDRVESSVSDVQRSISNIESIWTTIKHVAYVVVAINAIFAVVAGIWKLAAQH